MNAVRERNRNNLNECRPSPSASIATTTEPTTARNHSAGTQTDSIGAEVRAKKVNERAERAAFALNEQNEQAFWLRKPQITPKAQALLRHVVPFCREHGFWGRASEQPIEALHAIFTRDFRRFCAIKDKRKLYLQIAEVQEIRTYYFDNPL